MTKGLLWLSTSIWLLVAPPALFLEAQDIQLIQPQKHYHYKLIDLGTFGGPGGLIPNPSFPVLNRHGALVGASDTSFADPFDPNCFFDCYIDHGWVWRDGILTDLGTLPGGASSIPVSINARGQVAGQSQNGAIDTLTGWPEARAVVWEHGETIDLGTLGGTQSNAIANNDHGVTVGGASNGVPDPFSERVIPNYCQPFGDTFAGDSIFYPSNTEVHAIRWTRRTGMEDLGTLGGPDSFAFAVNNRGQIGGMSFTSFVPNSSGAPTVNPFLWEDGKMTDLGGLGGTFGTATLLNNRGDVIGCSNLLGDITTHPFIWTQTKGMRDLGTLGGTYGHPNWINDAGEVVGFATIAGDEHGHAFLWRHGLMKDLGTVGNDPDSESFGINSRGQVVGVSFILGGRDLHGFLWENGGTLVDLNTLVVPPSDFTVVSAIAINDRGEIGCVGRRPEDNRVRPCVLIPCDNAHIFVESCDFDLVDATTIVSKESASDKTPTDNGKVQVQFLGRLRHREHRTNNVSSRR